MSNFIKLTDFTTGSKIAVRIDHIFWYATVVDAHQTSSTTIYVYNREFLVHETVEQIDDLIDPPKVKSNTAARLGRSGMLP